LEETERGGLLFQHEFSSLRAVSVHREDNMQDRRDFMKLIGVGGVVFASRVARAAPAPAAGDARADFFFLQLSDTHYGFSGPPNPEAATTLERTVQKINESKAQPDFIVFTGDLTHTTDDAKVRRERMAKFKEITGRLKVKTLRFLAGEHDASLDRGEAYQEFFGPLHYAFDHKGLHFVVLDNVSDPGAVIGPAQIDWLAADLKRVDKKTPVVVLTHRPLFDLFPSWDWATKDGAKAIDVLSSREQVTVFYGHIHQEHHHQTGAIAHHSARSLMFALPAPGSVPKKAPVAWNPAKPYDGLGYRQIDAEKAVAVLRLEEQTI